jgi:hypothetical protein
MNGQESYDHINGRGDNPERVAILDAGAQYGKVEYQTIMHTCDEKNMDILL